jgi:hypothetical protein
MVLDTSSLFLLKVTVMKKFTLAHLMLVMGIGIFAVNLVFNHFIDVPTAINYFFRGGALVTMSFGFLNFRLVSVE